MNLFCLKDLSQHRFSIPRNRQATLHSRQPPVPVPIPRNRQATFHSRQIPSPLYQLPLPLAVPPLPLQIYVMASPVKMVEPVLSLMAVLDVNAMPAIQEMFVNTVGKMSFCKIRETVRVINI